MVKNGLKRGSGIVLLFLTLAGCASSPPLDIGVCVEDKASNVLLGSFPSEVPCPSEPRPIQDQLGQAIFKIVAVAPTVDELDAYPACRNDFSFSVWYDEDWAVCGERTH